MSFLDGWRWCRARHWLCWNRSLCSGWSRSGSLNWDCCRCDRSWGSRRRFNGGCRIGDLRVALACRGWNRGLYHHGNCGRHNCDGRTRRNCSYRGLGYDGSDGRLTRDGACRGRGRNDRRRLPNGRHNLSGFRTRCGRGRRGSGDDRRSRFDRRRLHDNGRGACRYEWFPDPCLVFLLLGQNGLHHVAGLGDVRQINLGCNPLRAARRRGRTCMASWPRAMIELRAYLFGFIFLKRAGVGFTRP
jgi:hypothetical protein